MIFIFYIMKLKDLTGLRIGKLTVIERVSDRIGGGGRKRVLWRCVCDCGKYTEVVSDGLLYGMTKSCGCLRDDFIKTVNFKHGEANKTKENRIWHHLRSRCHNKKDRKYKNYGGRGIAVCERWNNSYELFLADMGRCPCGMSIHRINNDKGYSPDNCKWANNDEQANEKTTNVFIEFSGNIMTMKQWSDLLGYNYKRFHALYRYKNKTMEELAYGRL